jgi:hypothetical protein
MPVLSFPCTLHRFGSGSQPERRRVWIKGHNLRSLAVAATTQLGVTPERCEYALVRSDGGVKSAWLEVTHADGDALVGPFAGPLPPSTMSRERTFSLDALLALLGFDSTSDHHLEHDDTAHPRDYLVVVAYSPISHQQPFPPVRQPREDDRRYAERRRVAENTRIERSRLQGFHLVSYDVAPKDWTAHDIDMLLMLAYGLLPTTEPRWRESGAITQAKFANPRDGHRVTIAHALQIARGDYIAYLQLPTFPTTALAEWLSSRHCEINLRHPVMKLELVARGWRMAPATDAALAVSTPAIDAPLASSR